MKDSLKKLSIEFPKEEYAYLKMACIKQGITARDFVTRAIIKSIEDYEGELEAKNLDIARKEIADTGALTWEELEKRLGWDKL